MHILQSMIACMLLALGYTAQSGHSAGRGPTDFVLVEARFEQPTAEAEKKLAELEAAVAEGKISSDQALKRRSQIEKSQNLLLLGYFGNDARVIEVQRADAESAGWSPKSIPTLIRFERIPAVRGASKVLGTSVSGMPRKGWDASSEPVATEIKYRVHPWLEQPGARPIKVLVSAEIRSTRFVPQSTQRVRTALGYATVGGAPDSWVVLVSMVSSEAEPFVGLFDVVDSTGKTLSKVEIDRAVQPGEQRDIEIVVYEDPQTSRGLQLRSVLARTAPNPSTPKQELPSENVTKP